jgi:DNA-binding response OmpR family regulator
MPRTSAWESGAQIGKLSRGLRQPERHPHLAQHRDSRRQLGPGLVQAADSAVQLAEAEVAVGLEGALVLVDLNLPYVNGDVVGDRIRALYGRALPIVMVAANHDGVEIAEALEAAYLPRPFNLDELPAAVWRCLV